MEVTRSRVQRLPLPVFRPLRLRRPAIKSSLAISTSSRTAATMSVDVLLRCPRRRFGRRISLWAPPAQCTIRTISDVASSILATTSLIRIRTIRFFSRASVVGADHTVCRFEASRPNAAGSTLTAGLAASCAAILLSISPTLASALFQRASSSPATNRLAGSAASYCRKARSAA